MTTDTSTHQDDAVEQDDQAQTAKTAGRGFLVITAAKLYFMVTGAAIQLGLPILFGSPEQFGIFKIVTEAISLINMVVITGTMQAVSKLVSEEPNQARHVVNQALKLQCLLGLPLAIAYGLGSGVLANSVFNDATLTPLMRMSSLIILFYAFYAIFVGYLNGVKSFVRQAILDISFQTLKTAGILGLVIIGAGVMGAISGFVAAAGVICVFSGIWVWRIMTKAHTKAPEQAIEAQDDRDRLKRLASFLVLVMIYTFALNGLMRADLFLIKSITSAPPTSMADLALVFKNVSDKFAGIYGAALNIARLPFQGVIAVTFVIFPLISEATFQQDQDKTRQYIQSTFRYCLILIAGVALPLIFNSDSVIAALYSADYQAASIALAILSVAIIFFALLYVAMTIIIGAGRPVVACVIMGVSLALSAVLNWWRLNSYHEHVMGILFHKPFVAPAHGKSASDLLHVAVQRADHDTATAAVYLARGPEYMQEAAIATAIAMFVGFVLAIGWLWRTYRATPPIGTTIRIIVAAGILFGIDMIFPLPVAWVSEKGKLFYLAMVAVKMTVMGLALLATFVLTREFGKDDLDKVRAVIGRKKKKTPAS